MIAEQETIESAEAYHADFSRDSHSSLSLFRESVPKYAAIRITRTMQPDPPTPEMRFGTAFHCLILEPERFAEEYIVAREWEPAPKLGRTKAGMAEKAIWQAEHDKKLAAWQEQHGHKTVLKQEEFDLLHAMRDGLMANANARAAIEADGPCEAAYRWTCPETGCPLKLRADKLLESKGLVVNLKTCTNRSLEDWGRTVFNVAYHRSDALYLEGLLQATGTVFEALAIAVSKDPPHETGCFILDDASIRAGRDDNLRTLYELADRRLTGNWGSRFHDGIQTVGLPAWALRR